MRRKGVFMSHSKYNKRGRSLYLDNWNPNAKKYINECKICGYKGYSPVIEQPDFLSGNDPFAFAVNKAIYEELSKTFSVLELDAFGRCKDCARIQDEK